MADLCRADFPLIICLFLASVTLASAQQQERKLYERLTKPDQNLTFNPSQHAIGTLRPYGTGATRTKGFLYDQKVTANAFLTSDYYGAKAMSAADKQYSARTASTDSKYAIPNAAKKADVKTMAVRDASEGEKTAATRDLWDGKRPYLGPESRKMGTAIDATTLADWRHADTVSTSGNTVERYSNLKPLTIDDVRELLNKNK